MLRVEAVVAVFAAALVLAGCGMGSPPPGMGGAQRMEAVAIPVEVTPVERGSISEYIETNANIEAERRVDVTSEGVGECVAILAEEGDRVEKGDVLAELDKEEALASLRQLEVQVAQDRANYKRAKQGVEEGFMPPVELENAEFALRMSEANLESQRITVENLTLRAPISGVVTQRNIHLGQLITSGAPAFSIADPSTVMLVVRPHERELPRLREGQHAEVTVDALGSDTFDAWVRRINPSVDPQTHTVKVTLDFTADVRKRLKMGGFARVRLILDTHEDVLLVPAEAIVEENRRTYLFVARKPAGGEERPKDSGAVEAGAPAETPDAQRLVAERVEVETGLEDGARVEVREGVEAGDLVVTMGQQSLKDGAIVRITSIETELARNDGLSAEEALAEAEELRESGQVRDQQLGHGF